MQIGEIKTKIGFECISVLRVNQQQFNNTNPNFD